MHFRSFPVTIRGPQGAAAGWMIGSTYATAKSKIDQRSIGDLTSQTASYGVQIPNSIGYYRLAGNIIWAKEKTTYDIKTKTSKTSGTTITTGYQQSFAILLCKGPIAGVRRVWINNTLAVDGTQKQVNLPFILYTGSDTQTPDPTMEADKGVGNVPAYRGLAYAVFTDFDLGSSGSMPNFEFEILGSQGF